MTELNKYCLTLPQTQIRADSPELTFTINNIKCRNHGVVYFKFKGYDYHNTLITEHTSSRWIITDMYTLQEETFELTFMGDYSLSDLDNYIIEIYTLGIDSENPLYFNKLQLNNGEHKDYHIPNEESVDVRVGFNNCTYINLYGDNDNYLQIIRPEKGDLTTNLLTKNKMTILAPHIADEPKWDDPVALLYEFTYMSEQRITVEK